MLKTATKTGALFFAIFLFAGCEITASIDTDNRESAEESFRYTIDTSESDVLELVAINGSVELIRTSSNGEIVVRGIKRVEASSRSTAQQELSNLHVAISEVSDGWLVETDQPSNTGNREYEISYVIEYPADMKAFIQNENGNVSSESVGHTPDVRLTNGNVELAATWNGAEIAVVNGTVTADVDLESNGMLEISVVNGTVDLRLSPTTSALFTASLTNGSISLTGLPFLSTVQSQSRLEGTIGQGNGRIDISTVNGSISVRPTSN